MTDRPKDQFICKLVKHEKRVFLTKSFCRLSEIAAKQIEGRLTERHKKLVGSLVIT